MAMFILVGFLWVCFMLTIKRFLKGVITEFFNIVQSHNLIIQFQSIKENTKLIVMMSYWMKCFRSAQICQVWKKVGTPHGQGEPAPGTDTCTFF